jgi:L-histidine N-alpha-methyltransferase
METAAIDLASPGRDATAEMAREVREGLSSPRPTLPSKYFYDDRGIELFDEITRLPEYYPTRTETAILAAHADEILKAAAPRELVELGSGAGRKIRLLLDAMGRAKRRERVTFLDVNRAALEESAAALMRDYPGLVVRGVVGDFQRDLGALPAGRDRLLLFLAGTIGNLSPSDEVPAFLRAVGRVLTPGERFLVGLDLVKDVSILEPAYDDAAGVTAEFNRNVLRVVNDRLGADFEPERWEHVAFFDREHSWIEMRLRATAPMRVRVPGASLDLSYAAGDEIRTEISCKWTKESFAHALEGTGLACDRWFTDPAGWFADALLVRA